MTHLFRFLLIALGLTLLAVPTTSSASPSISIAPFESSDPSDALTFPRQLRQALTNKGLECVFNSTSNERARYSLNGVVERSGGNVAYSAMFSDTFNIEPDLFFKGKQRGGESLNPAAEKLASSILSMLQNSTISVVDIRGNNHLTAEAISNLAGIQTGDTADVGRIIAARMILKESGLFNSVRLHLEPGEQGKKIYINVDEYPLVTGNPVKPVKTEKLQRLLGDSSKPRLPSFRIAPPSVNATCISGMHAFNAEKLMTELELASDEQAKVEILERIITTAEALRYQILSPDQETISEQIVLLGLCSTLTPSVVNGLEGYFRRQLQQAGTAEEVDRVVNLTGLFDRSVGIAARIQEILGSRLYLEAPDSPSSPWVLQKLGDLAATRGDAGQAELLYKAAAGSSQLPVGVPLLISLAESRYRNLHQESGDRILEALDPMLSPKIALSVEDKARITDLSYLSELCSEVVDTPEDADFAALLSKGHALISLKRPDMAEPLFHKLHGMHPSDARPFTGFARLAFQRSGQFYAARSYIQKAATLENRDRPFYELALGCALDRVVNEALPAIEKTGRPSEQAAAALYLLPRALGFAEGYRTFNPAKASILESGLTVFKDWLSYPSMPSNEAFDSLFKSATEMRAVYPLSSECAASALFSSIFVPAPEASRRAAMVSLPGNAGHNLKLLRLNTLMRSMNMAPDNEQATTLAAVIQTLAPGYSDRGRSLSAQADGLALAGIHLKDAAMLDRAKSLYKYAADNLEAGEKSRILNNYAVVLSLTGKEDEADDIFNESIDLSPACLKTVESNQLYIHGSRVSPLTVDNTTEVYPPQTVETNTIPLGGTSCNAFDGNFAVMNEQAEFKPEYDEFGRLNLLFKYEAFPWLSFELITLQNDRASEKD